MLPDCEIVEAENGAGALAMFNEMEKLDLIFVDMDLGDMEGITLAGTAKRLFQTAKIILRQHIPSMPQRRMRWRLMIIS